MKLWINGIFHTLENPTQTYSKMITHEGLIIGFDEDVEGYTYDEVIDVHQGHVYPGFVDAHMHLLGYGQMLSRLNLSNIKDKTKVFEDLKKAFQHEPLFAEGYFECGVTKHDLNQISKEIPIMIRHNDYHSLTVNDFVLQLMNIEHATGVLTEEVAQKAMDTFPKYTHEGLKGLLEKALKQLYRFGITGAHSDDLYYFNGFNDTLKAFEEVLKHFPFRAHLLMHHLTIDDFIRSKRPFLDQNKYLQLGAVKMFYDGTLSSKTALMYTPYKDLATHGLNVNGYEQFIEIVKKARAYELPVAIHVIGDLGFDQVLDILEAYPPKPGVLDRLIHTPWVKKETLKRLKNMTLSIDIQPQFLSSDLPWALSYLSETPDLCFPWKSLLSTGVNLAGSSDAPVETPDPLLGIYQAIERRSSHDHQVYFEDEKLSRFEAISLYTIHANYNTEASNRGYLKSGYIADFSIFRDDLLTVPMTDFLENKAIMTVVDEKICFDTNSFQKS